MRKAQNDLITVDIQFGRAGVQKTSARSDSNDSIFEPTPLLIVDVLQLGLFASEEAEPVEKLQTLFSKVPLIFVLCSVI